MESSRSIGIGAMTALIGCDGGGVWPGSREDYGMQYERKDCVANISPTGYDPM